MEGSFWAEGARGGGLDISRALPIRAARMEVPLDRGARSLRLGYMYLWEELGRSSRIYRVGCFSLIYFGPVLPMDERLSESTIVELNEGFVRFVDKVS